MPMSEYPVTAALDAAHPDGGPQDHRGAATMRGRPAYVHPAPETADTHPETGYAVEDAVKRAPAAVAAAVKSLFKKKESP